jgi:serine phosphatase RsbU (regulator of sigma subunit)/CHASE2 domain-containing sensor protein
MTGSKSSFRTTRRQSRVWPLWALFALLGIVASLLTGEQTRRTIFDAWQQISPRKVEAANVRVVLIDGKSLAAVGPWPWSRYYLARLTEDIARQDAKVIGFDVLFPEPDRLTPARFAELYPELDAVTAGKVSTLPSMDQVFGQVIGASPVVLARAGVSDGNRDGASVVVDAKLTGTMPRRIDQWPAALTAIPELEDVALGHGLVNGQPDGDGVIRAVPLVMKVAGRPMPGLAMELARLSKDADEIRVAPNLVQVADRAVPIDARGRMQLRFGHFPQANVVSAADVSGGAVRPDYFRGKTVLIGLAAEGTSDIVATPLAAESFGVVMQAQAVDAILTGGWLSRPAWTDIAEWILAAVLALLALAVAWRWRALPTALAAAFIALPIASWFAFERFGLLLDPARPFEVGAAALAGVTIGLFAETRRERERLRLALVEEQKAAAKTEGELQAAREIQMAMVPPRGRVAAVDPRLDADAILEPARSVGGDLYDLFRLDEDRVSFVIGDVTGKGVPAALYMAMSKALTSFILTRENADLSGAIGNVNDELLRSGGDALSVTMIIGVIDLRSGAVSLVCAGHEDPITLKPNGTVATHRLEGGPPLGLVPYVYPAEQLQLAAGDTLILVTDGITEAQDRHGALFGHDRLLATIGPSDNARTICQGLRDAVRAFENGIEPTDDLTAMVLRFVAS